MKPEVRENQYIRVLLIAQRTRQLRKGARPRVNMPGTRDTRIAREEVRLRLISFADVFQAPDDKTPA
ncbi:MAG: DNA-directed RNA polymerase subunit omega [Blastocatellia bacterium]